MHAGCRIDQVFLCRDPVDFRKSIGGLSVLVEQSLGLDPFGSALYVFINRDRNKIKVLYWHRNGFCLWLKRLEAKKFAWPRDADGATRQQFEWLLEGFDLWQKPPHKTLHFSTVSKGNLVNYGVPSATAKSSNMPPRYSLPELALPAVLPTDAASLTALLHSVIAAHNDVKTQALNHMPGAR